MKAYLFLFALRGVDAGLGCSECLQDNDAAFGGDTSAVAHAWCYTTGQCMAIGVSVFSSCPDFTFDYGTCECRPDIYTTCDRCATASHLGCIW